MAFLKIIYSRGGDITSGTWSHFQSLSCCSIFHFSLSFIVPEFKDTFKANPDLWASNFFTLKLGKKIKASTTMTSIGLISLSHIKNIFWKVQPNLIIPSDVDVLTTMMTKRSPPPHTHTHTPNTTLTTFHLFKASPHPRNS